MNLFCLLLALFGSPPTPESDVWLSRCYMNIKGWGKQQGPDGFWLGWCSFWSSVNDVTASRCSASFQQMWEQLAETELQHIKTILKQWCSHRSRRIAGHACTCPACLWSLLQIYESVIEFSFAAVMSSALKICSDAPKITQMKIKRIIFEKLMFGW